MDWLGWSLIVASMALWGLGALGWVDEVRELLRKQCRRRP
jgi:hypothetical protein